MSDLRRILQRSESTDRLVVILLWVMALALIILLPPALSKANNAQSATESQTESSPESTLLDGEQTIDPLESTSGSDTSGRARNRTSIKIDTSLPADLTVNGDEISLPADGEVDDSVVTDSGSNFSFSINSTFNGDDDGDLDIKIKSKTDLDIDNDIEETYEVNN